MSSYKTEDISIEELAEEIKTVLDFPNTEEQIQNNIYFIDASNGVNRGSIYSSLSKINNTWKLESHWTIKSHRAVLGDFIVFGKKILRKLFGWYIRPITEQQTQFNANVTRILNEFNLIMNRLIENDSKVSSSLRTIRKQIKQEEINVEYLDFFQNKLKDDEKSIEAGNTRYLSYFLAAKNVLDIGCGRGDFLRVLTSSCINALGIDMSSQMVNYCKSQGLNVIQSEAEDYLKNIENNSLDGIFIGHVIEHLPPTKIVKLINLCYEKLGVGGCIVVETLNPQSLSIFSSSLYVNMTQLRPVHHSTLEFLLENAGFVNTELEFLNPVSSEAKLKQMDLNIKISDELKQLYRIINENFSKLNNDVYGYQDYMLAAYKQ